MQKRARQAIVTVTAGLTLVGGVTTAAVVMSSGQGGDAAHFAQLPPAVETSTIAQPGPSAETQSTTSTSTSTAADSTVAAAQAAPPVKVTATETSEKSTATRPSTSKTGASKTGASKTGASGKAKKLPAGRATATSFWDAQTASGKPMRYQTIASPYWPLGTKVKVSYNGKSVVGVVEDFGPAEWAVAQHDLPAIIDLSEKMMADLTGVRSNSVHVNFEVLKWGSGRVYRTSGTGYKLAMGR